MYVCLCVSFGFGGIRVHMLMFFSLSVTVKQ